MQATPPDKPVVVLLGGSAARESTISDASWRDQIVAKGGPATLAWNMGSRNRTMAQNVAVVKALPKGVKALVYIGINLGSFTSAQKTASITLPSPAPTSSPRSSSRTSTARRRASSPTAKKRALVQGWLADRYPVYKRNFATSAACSRRSIKVCQTRGYKPVLFELPRNTDDHRWLAERADDQVSGPSARALAAKYGIPWVSLVAAAQAAQLRLLRPLAPGGAGPHGVAGPAERQDGGPAQDVRIRWRRLVRRLLKRYRMPKPTPSPSPSPSSSPSAHGLTGPAVLTAAGATG